MILHKADLNVSNPNFVGILMVITAHTVQQMLHDEPFNRCTFRNIMRYKLEHCCALKLHSAVHLAVCIRIRAIERIDLILRY